VKIGVEKEGLAGMPLMSRSAEVGFGWINHKYHAEKPLTWKFDSLAGVPKLFIEAADDPELAGITQKMFKSAPDPKEQATIPRGNFVDMEDADKRAYENRVVSYFLLRLPATRHVTR
jgi:hypothetical protein